MDEEEALRSYCRAMMSSVRVKQQLSEEKRRRHEHGGAGERDRTETERQVSAGTGFRGHRGGILPLPDRLKPQRDQTSLSPCQGPSVRPVPPQLITRLRLKTLKEELRRDAEVELHDPSVCTLCQQDQASLALTAFIRRKKTQLQFQTLKDRLNTSWRLDTFGGVVEKPPKVLRCPSLDLGGTTWRRYAGHSNLGLP